MNLCKAAIQLLYISRRRFEIFKRMKDASISILISVLCCRLTQKIGGIYFKEREIQNQVIGIQINSTSTDVLNVSVNCMWNRHCQRYGIKDLVHA